MRLAIGGFAHETVTFLPETTGVAAFEQVALRGDDIFTVLSGTNTDAGGMIDACVGARVDIEGLVHAAPPPSGPVGDAAYDAYLAEMIERLHGLQEPVDGLLLHLHGAMATENRQDPETDFVRDLHAALGRDLPIGLSMDLHGNLDPALLDHVTLLCGYHESPHIDMDRTGARTATLLIRTLRGEIAPVCAMAKPGIVLPSIFTATRLAPLSDLMAAARRWEREPGVLDVSVFTGFAYADVAPIGMSIVAVTDNDAALAQRVADDLAETALAMRDGLYKRDLLLGVDDAIARATEITRTADKPVVLLEHADRKHDSTYTLRGLVANGTLKAAVPYLWDPDAVQTAIQAGIGNQVTLTVGGTSSGRAGGPVEITGTVRFAGPKAYAATGPFKHGAPMDLGDCALIEAGNVTLSLVSNLVMAVDDDPFTQFGLEVNDFDVVVLRSKTHFRAAWEDLAEDILIVETPDWGPADLSTLPYRNVPPGVFPVTG